jgi:hypothetical protein
MGWLTGMTDKELQIEIELRHGEIKEIESEIALREKSGENVRAYIDDCIHKLQLKRDEYELRWRALHFNESNMMELYTLIEYYNGVIGDLRDDLEK